MSRYGRTSGDDLAYGEYNNRWDRDRFDRFGRGPPQPPEPPRRFEEDFRFSEHDRPGRRDVTIEDHKERFDARSPRGQVDERERIFRETYGPRRRTDRELFGQVDPREIAEMAMTPYNRDREAPPRPGLMRRQSSLDTFDRRPIPRYDKEEQRLAPYREIPLPIRRKEDDIEEIRFQEGGDTSYREIEVKREHSVHRRGGKKKSKAPTVASSSSSSSSFEEIDKISHHSQPPPKSGFKKGKTRMPKRLVFKEAIMDLGYPFVEKDNFYVLQIALEKEQIDEVIRISEVYKSGEKHKTYRYEDKVEIGGSEAATSKVTSPDRNGREEIIRKEFINPPSDFLGTDVSRRSRSTRRAHSPSIESSISQRTARRSRSRAPSQFVEERKTVIEEGGGGGRRSRAPSAVLPGPEYFEERKTVVEERSPGPHHSGALVFQEREHRSDRDIQAEIAALEVERRALRHERERDDYQLVEYRDDRPRREVLEIIERDNSPPRNVVRVEKDRKGRMALVRSTN